MSLKQHVATWLTIEESLPRYTMMYMLRHSIRSKPMAICFWIPSIHKRESVAASSSASVI